MGLSRRQFTKEFKLAAVRRLEQGISIGEATRALEVNPNVLHREDRTARLTGHDIPDVGEPAGLLCAPWRERRIRWPRCVGPRSRTSWIVEGPDSHPDAGQPRRRGRWRRRRLRNHTCRERQRADEDDGTEQHRAPILGESVRIRPRRAQRISHTGHKEAQRKTGEHRWTQSFRIW